MANPEGGVVNRTIDEATTVVNSGSVANKNDQDAASDHEQQGGLDASGQKAGKMKKSCFQITSVVSKRNAAEHDVNNDDPDSNDELDESRVEDFSSSELLDSFNVSKTSISELDKSVDDVAGNSVPSHLPGNTDDQANVVVVNSANQANGNGPHRFKVVKVATEPIRKGRWTCRDFPSETVKGANQASAPESLRNHEGGKDTLHSGNSSAASSVHYVHGQDNNSDNPLASGEEGGKPSDLSRKISSTSSKSMGHQTDNGNEEQKDDKLGLEQLKDELQEHASETSEGDDGTSPAGGAIDNKIEQAMDLVKSHLLFAVREEVEVLKEQIKVLLEKNEMLQEENTTLRKRLNQSTNPLPPQQSTHQHQGLPVQTQNQDQTQYQSMPNQMGQAMSDHAAYPQHPRPTQQTHSTPNPGMGEQTATYTPQSVEPTGQYHVPSQGHIQTSQAPQQPHHLPPQGMQDMSQYSQVGASMAAAAAPPATPSQGQYHQNLPAASGNRTNTTH